VRQSVGSKRKSGLGHDDVVMLEVVGEVSRVGEFESWESCVTLRMMTLVLNA
jgi:hypothetical protein